MSIVTRLPNDPFTMVNGTGLSSNLAIRRLCHPTKGGWVYAVNPGYWAFHGTLTLHVSSSDAVFNVSDGTKSIPHGGLSLHLPAFGIAAWRSTGCIDVVSTTMSPISRQELAHMTDVIGLVANHSHSLPPAEQETTSRVGGRALEMLAARAYTAAWSLIKVPQYWTLWQSLSGFTQPL